MNSADDFAPGGVPSPPRADLRVVASAALAIAWFTLPLALSFVLFARLGQVTDWLHGLDGSGWIVATAGFALLAGTGLLPTYAQSVLMGWVFGFALGTPIAIGGYVGGAVLGYGISRLAAGDSIRQRIDSHPRWRVVRSALVDACPARTLFLVALLRFPPNSPFAFTNLVLAATGVRFVPMLVGSVMGMLPRTAVAVWIGAEGAATGAKDLTELVDKQGMTAVLIGVALLVVVLVIMQHIGKRALRAAGLEQG